MKTRHLLLVSAALLASAHAETANTDALVADAERAIERAYLRGSTAQLTEAVKPIDAALAADPTNPALLYERAFAHYAATSALRAARKNPPLIAEFEKAAAILERVRGQPWEAEAAALHSCILGNLIGIKGGMSGMTLGPKSGQLMSRAAKALPAGNPRLQLFRGISLLNTPKAFGGNPAEGTKLLQQAVEVFAAEAGAGNGSAPAAGPRWGRADALTWLGIAQQKAGDLAAARATWEQVLAIEPDHGWVKFGLLPSLDKPAAK